MICVLNVKSLKNCYVYSMVCTGLCYFYTHIYDGW